MSGEWEPQPAAEQDAPAGTPGSVVAPHAPAGPADGRSSGGERSSAADRAVEGEPSSGDQSSTGERSSAEDQEPAGEQPSTDDQASGSGPPFTGEPEPQPQEAEAVEQQRVPDLTSDEALDAALEALLLVVDVPAGEELLADTLEQPVQRVRQALQRLSDSYAESERGIDLRRVGDGWRLYTREVYAPYVERYLLDGQRTKLTRAALETLAVIAYRQPVTRARVAAVRGVNVDGVIRTLVGRGLVEEAGTDPETGGNLYCTTELFLERLGLSSLKDLPPLAPLLPEVDSIDDV